MAVDLLPEGTVDKLSVGPYSGLLASSFMFGRMLSSYPWGYMADVYGRTFVLISSLVLSAIFSSLFGLSQKFTEAIICRFLLGVTNGLVGTVKTLVSELAPNPDLETKMMGLVVGMRACGFLISPAIGGWLADPIGQYPLLFSDVDAWYYAFLSRYPFLLPNIIGSFLCLVTAVLVWGCIPETLPGLKKENQLCTATHDFVDTIINSGRFCGGKQTEEQGVEGCQSLTEQSLLLNHPKSNTEFGETTDGCLHTNQTATATMKSIWEIPLARKHLIPYWIFSFAVASLDEAFPLFCIASVPAGLALAEKSIGKILSCAGLLFVLFQYFVYVQTVQRIGLYKSLWIGVVAGFLPVLFVPLARSLQYPTQEKGHLVTDDNVFSPLNQSTFFLLVSIMAFSKIFCCMFFTSISIALNKTVSGQQRGTLNGIASLGGSIFKGLGPILIGFMSRFCFSIGIGGVGAVLVFSGIVCTGVSALLFLVELKPS